MPVINSLRKLLRPSTSHAPHSMCLELKAMRTVISDIVEISAEGLKKILNNLEKEIVDSPVEIGIIIDPKTGREVLRKTGTESTVHFTFDEKKLLRGKIFTHNHPAVKTGLSPNDINFGFTNGLQEIRAVVDDNVHSIKIPDNFTVKSIPREIREKAEQGSIRSLPILNRKSKPGAFVNSLYKKVLYGIKSIPADLAGTTKGKVAKDIYYHFLTREIGKDIALFGEEIAGSLVESIHFWDSTYKRFTEAIPGSSYSIEPLIK